MKNKNQETAILLSLVTPPFLLGITVIDSLTQGLKELGSMSEEIFRGERLPLLNFPEVEPDNTENL
ncbi:MAG: hypothetical protein AB4058_18850 [Microcystaceae cyanobacterium]